MSIGYYKQFEPIDGKWYITRELGKGAYGTVFEVERRDFGETLKSAMKVISVPGSEDEIRAYKQKYFENDDAKVKAYFYGFVEELVKSLQLMYKLRGHSNIVSHEDHTIVERKDRIGWDIFVRMELLTPIHVYYAEHDIYKSDVIKLGISVCKALELCSRNLIVHRDIKPSNIFITDTGEYKLGDFGVAGSLKQAKNEFAFKGVCNYMAPEVYKGEVCDGRADIYSLGLVMYRLLNDNLDPFQTARTHAEEEKALTMRLHGEKPEKPAHAKDHLGDIVLKACSYAQDARYQTAEELRVDLEKELESMLTVGDGKSEHGFAVCPSCGRRFVQDGSYAFCDSCGEKLQPDNNTATEELVLPKSSGFVNVPAEPEHTKDATEPTPKHTEEISGAQVDLGNKTELKKAKSKLLPILSVGAGLIALLVAFVLFVSGARGKLIEKVPDTFDVVQGETVSILDEVYCASFFEGNVAREVEITPVAEAVGIYTLIANNDGATLSGLQVGTAQVYVRVNGSAAKTVQINVYAPVDAEALLSKINSVEALLDLIRADTEHDLSSIQAQVDELERILAEKGDVRRIIADGDNLELCRCNVWFETQVRPIYEQLDSAYAALTNTPEDTGSSTNTHTSSSGSGSNGSSGASGYSDSSGSGSNGSTGSSGTNSGAGTQTVTPYCPVCYSKSHTDHSVVDPFYIPKY